MNKYSGGNFDDFLKEEGILEEVVESTRKRKRHWTGRSQIDVFSVLPIRSMAKTIMWRWENRIRVTKNLWLRYLSR